MIYTISIKDKKTGKEIARDYELDKIILSSEDILNYRGLGKILYDMKINLNESEY